MTSTGQHRVSASKTSAPEPSIGQLVSDVSTNVSTLIQGEIALAKLELKASVKNAGTGVAMFAAAAVLLVFSLTFGFIALAEGLVAAGLWRWLSYLIVFAFFVLVALVLVLIGVKKVKKVKGPEQTIATSKDTVAYLKANTPL